MGYIKHHAIVVTSYHNDDIKKAKKKANKIFGKHYVSKIIITEVNGYHSFFISPDGSKEGWGESNDGDENREKFVEWLNKYAYDDGSNSLSFCEFFYGDDEGKSKIVNHN